MPGLAYAALALICPLAMGVMMWMMMRGHRMSDRSGGADMAVEQSTAPESKAAE